MQHSTFAKSQGRIRSVLIVDDHPLYRDALASAVGSVFPEAEVETAGTLKLAMEILDRGFLPDMVMFDLKLPDVAGISGFMNLRNRLPDRPILVISSLASHELVHALMKEGAAGFMPKDYSAKDLKTLLLEVADGKKFLPKDFQNAERSAAADPTPEDIHPKLALLTGQQQRVLKLICAGKPNKQIAFELNLAEATVKAHITALLRRLGVNNRTQAAVLVEAMQQQSGTDASPEARSFLAR